MLFGIIDASNVARAPAPKNGGGAGTPPEGETFTAPELEKFSILKRLFIFMPVVQKITSILSTILGEMAVFQFFCCES